MKLYKNFLTLCLAICAPVFHAQAAEYDFKDPKGVNHIVFMLDAPLEFISGSGNDITGKVEFDSSAPEKTSGSIHLGSASLSVANKKMTEVMQGKKWLNVPINTNVVFDIDSLKVTETDGDMTKGIVAGSLTLMGVKKTVNAPVTITLVKDGAKTRGYGKGDLLVVRSEFSIKLGEYGLKLNPATRLKVSNEVQLKVVLAGYGQ